MGKPAKLSDAHKSTWKRLKGKPLLQSAYENFIVGSTNVVWPRPCSIESGGITTTEATPPPEGGECTTASPLCSNDSKTALARESQKAKSPKMPRRDDQVAHGEYCDAQQVVQFGCSACECLTHAKPRNLGETR